MQNENRVGYLSILNDGLADIAKKQNRQCKVLANTKPCFQAITATISEVIFGIQPMFDVDKVKKILTDNENNIFEDKNKFIEYIDDNINNPEIWVKKENIQDDKEEKALFARCLIAISNQFCVALNISNDIKDDFESDLIRNKIFYRDEEKSDIISVYRIFGRLTKEQHTNLETKWAIRRGNELEVVKKENFANTEGFDTLYKDLTTSKNLYSGVITNIVKIEEIEDGKEANLETGQIKLTLNCTTFFTVLGMGYPQLSPKEGHLYKNYPITEHPLLNEYKEILEKINCNEITLQKQYILNEKPIDIKLINIYLNKSVYPHIISIAGNIITNDDFLLFIKRGNNIEHENMFSCALTGYSEVYKKEVKFYNNSVEEDKPTIRLSKDDSITFNSEFVREARAEYGISTIPSDWRNYGIIISGHKYDNQDTEPLTIDFEIAAEAKCLYSLETIIDSQKNAIEHNEAKNVIGCKINIYQNRVKQLISILLETLHIISNNKDVVTILILLAMQISKGIINISLFVNSIDSILNTFFNFILILLLLIDFFEWIKKSKYKKSISTLLEGRNTFKKKIGKISTENSNYLVYSMLNLYLISRKEK